MASLNDKFFFNGLDSFYSENVWRIQADLWDEEAQCHRSMPLGHIEFRESSIQKLQYLSMFLTALTHNVSIEEAEVIIKDLGLEMLFTYSRSAVFK